LAPFLGFLECHAAQVLFEALVDALGLSIGLWMVGCGEFQGNLQGSKYLFPWRIFGGAPQN
jgi:hypothetical protein